MYALWRTLANININTNTKETKLRTFPRQERDEKVDDYDDDYDDDDHDHDGSLTSARGRLREANLGHTLVSVWSEIARALARDDDNDD